MSDTSVSISTSTLLFQSSSICERYSSELRSSSAAWVSGRTDRSLPVSKGALRETSVNARPRLDAIISGRTCFQLESTRDNSGLSYDDFFGHAAKPPDSFHNDPPGVATLQGHG